MSRYYHRLPDGTTWPRPEGPGGDMDSVEWVMRYGDPERVREYRFLAASFCAAFSDLVAMPRRRREQVIADLRKAASEAKP